MKEVVLMAYGLFAGHSLLLAAMLFVRHKNSGNRWLGIILLLLTARVGKSIVSLAIPPLALPVNVIGLMSMAALGPLMLFYVEELYTFSRTQRKKKVLHLLPAAICAGAWNWTLINAGYFVITAQLVGYLAYTVFVLLINHEIYAVDNIRWRWTKGVILGILVMSISFIVQLFVYSPALYLTNIGLSVIVLYLLSWWALRQNKLFVEDASKKNSDSEPEAYTQIGEKVKRLMDADAFVDSDLDLSKLAKNLGLRPYILSKAINSFFKMSFPELMLDYRLRKAEQLLSSHGKIYTIEAIAYESGFNTLSVFYQAFKKRNAMTPAQYKKRMEESVD